MMDRYEASSVIKMAEFLKLRRKTQGHTVLILGARAGGLFRSALLPEALRFFSDNFSALSPVQRFAECYRILNRGMLSQQDMDKVVTMALKGVEVDEADFCVVQLMKRGYFTTLITTNIDNLLERACSMAHLTRRRDFELFLPGKAYLARPELKNPPFALLKVFGDLATQSYSIADRISYLTRSPELKDFIEGLRRVNVLLVGFDPAWDQDLLPLLFPRTGAVWYVDSEAPTPYSRLAADLQACRAEYIQGSEGEYMTFFRQLYGQIGGDSDPSRRASTRPSTPEAPPAESTSTIQLLLEERALAVRQDPSSRLLITQKALEVSITPLYTRLPGAMLAYYREDTMPLVKYEITNKSDEPVKVVLSVGIKEYAQPAVDTIEVGAQSQITHYQMPHLNVEKTRLLDKTEQTLAHMRVNYLKDGVELHHSVRDFRVYLMARNMIRWGLSDAKHGGRINLLHHLAAWVTPRTDPVRVMLRNAVYYHPRKILNGYPTRVDPEVPRLQVKAIFQALKEMGRIANDPAPFAVGADDKSVVQTVRLPDQSLRERRANGIDWTVLYASLLEAAGLEPLIVLQPHRALVGWKIARNHDDYEFLEPALTLEAAFEEACAEGTQAYHLLHARGLFECEPLDPSGFAALLDIRRLHLESIRPMDDPSTAYGSGRIE